MSTVADRSAVAAALIQQFNVSNRMLQEQIFAIALEPSATKRKRMLRALRRQYGTHAAALDALSKQWATSGLDSAFSAGRTLFYNLIGKLPPTNAPEWADLQALKVDGYGRLSNAIDHVETDISKMIRADSSKLDRILFGKRDPEKISANLKRELSRLAVSGVVYKNGARHTIDDYSSMVINTVTSRVYNMGTISAAEAEGTEFLTISDGPDCGLDAHGVPPMANGMVVTLEEARANPLAHPHCVRSFQPWIGIVPEPQQEGSPFSIPSSLGLQQYLARIASRLRN